MKVLLVLSLAIASVLATDDICDVDPEHETCVDDNVVKSVVAEFVNLSPYSASLYWDDGDRYTLVTNSIPSGRRQVINTYVGHRFQWMREGTRDAVSGFVPIEEGVVEYFLPKDAFEKHEEEIRQRGNCYDRNPRQCERDAARGECGRNPGWMIVNCPVACESCELLDPAKRCDPAFLNVSEVHVWEAGDVNNLFEEILEKYPELGARAVSRPPQGPWIIVFDNFLSDDEADRLVDVGGGKGFKRSTDTGTPNDRGEVTKVVSQGRTSENAWCDWQCDRDPLIKGVSDRIEQVTKVPQDNYEQFQILRYDIGQFYRTHHDMGDPNRRAGGHRILTFFLYLSDVEEGGQTRFPSVYNPETGELGLDVFPKKGQAVLWPSVLDEDPYKKDIRTRHSAEPVVKGVKYAANHWIHSHNFKKANLWGCTGAFD